MHTFDSADSFDGLTLGLRVEQFFETMFKVWGTFVAKNPFPVIIGSLFVSCYLAAAVFTKWQVTTDPVDLWVPAGSKARQDMEHFNEKFWKFYRIEQIIIEPQNLSDFEANVEGAITKFGPVFHHDFLLKAFDLMENVLSMRAEVDDEIVTLNDICVKPLGSDCLTQSVFTYYHENRTLLSEQNYLQKILTCTR